MPHPSTPTVTSKDSKVSILIPIGTRNILPGDKGMQALADELWKAIQKQANVESVKRD